MTQSQIITPGSAEWHAERRLGIGGSDAAAALGLSKWKTPYQLYLEKTGEAEPELETWEMQRGKALEPALRQHYADTTGRVVSLPKSAIVHPKYSFMRYNPDGLPDDPERLAEFKTAAYGAGWGDEQSDEIPQEYAIQVQHGMFVTGRVVTDVTVSIAGNKPKYFIVEADKELQEMIIEKEAEFWDKVENRLPPAPTTNEDVAKIYRKVNGASIVALPHIEQELLALKGIRNKLAMLTADKERSEVIIKDFMGEFEALTDAFGNALITWKQAKGAERLDTKALKDMEPDVYERFIKVGEPTRRFLVK